MNLFETLGEILKPEKTQPLFVIEWESGRGLRYYDGTNAGCQVFENALKYESADEAQAVIVNEIGDATKFWVKKLD